MPEKPPRQSAFTLVELLVVISIIALLIAILLPSLKKARSQARQVKCNANLRSTAQAGLTYATDDAQELAIPIGPGDGDKNRVEAYYSFIGFGGKSGIGPLGYNASTSIFGGGNSMGSVHRPLNQLLYRSGLAAGSGASGGRGGGLVNWSADAQLKLDVFKCPGDKGFPGYHMKGWKDRGGSAYDYFGTSYAANPYLVGLGQGSPLDSNSMYLRPMSRVPNPTNTVLFWEFAARYAVFATNPEEYNQSVGACWPWATGGYTARGHHDRDWYFNVSFGDGHAKWIKVRGYGITFVDNMPPSCPGSYCICITQRGLGWQVDTLPAELIPTHKIRDGSNGTLNADRDGGDDAFAVVP